MSVNKITDIDLENASLNEGTKLVKYYADWCGSCKLIAAKFKKLSDKEEYQNVEFLEVNAEESPALRKLANVTDLPFFALFKDGKLVKAETTSKIESVEALLN